MAERKDFEEVIYNEDGSVTTRTQYTQLPATKKDKAIAATVLGAITLVSISPLFITLREELKYRRDEKKAQKEHEKRLQEIKDTFKVD